MWIHMLTLTKHQMIRVLSILNYHMQFIFVTSVGWFFILFPVKHMQALIKCKLLQSKLLVYIYVNALTKSLFTIYVHRSTFNCWTICVAKRNNTRSKQPPGKCIKFWNMSRNRMGFHEWNSRICILLPIFNRHAHEVNLSLNLLSSNYCN